MTDQDRLNTPWSLHFDRDGTEDFGIICDAEMNDLVASHLPSSNVPRLADRPFGTGCFWLPEEDGDKVPLLVRQMQVMTAAPKLLDTLRFLLTDQNSQIDHESRLIAEAAIAEATTYPPSVSPLPIVITVRGGVVQDVQNLPDGRAYKVRDYDDREEDDGAAPGGRKA
jgi:hypothetical protein